MSAAQRTPGTEDLRKMPAACPPHHPPPPEGLSRLLTPGPFSSSAQAPTHQAHHLHSHPVSPNSSALKPYSSSARVITSLLSQSWFWSKVEFRDQNKPQALVLSPSSLS